MDEIRPEIILSIARTLDDSYNIRNPIFPMGESGLFVNSMRVPVSKFSIEVDKEKEYLNVSIPLRYVDFVIKESYSFPEDIPEVDWDADEQDSD